MRVLLTSTSFQDCEGVHKELLDQQGWAVSYLRGPLRKDQILDVVDKYDALICGDDELDREVLTRGYGGNLKYISKYGVGLDKIDLEAAKDLGIQVTNCRGVNQVAVAEHVIALMFAFFKNIHTSHNLTSQGLWKRPTGTELHGKKLGIMGLGAIGKELAIRAAGLGLKTMAYDLKLDDQFAERHSVLVAESLEELFGKCDIVSIHVPLLPSTKGLISSELFSKTKPGLTLINTSRGGLVQEEAVLEALDSGKLMGYLTDVLEEEPIGDSCLLRGNPRVLITPHVGSRTKETIQRQGTMAVQNLVKLLV